MTFSPNYLLFLVLTVFTVLSFQNCGAVRFGSANKSLSFAPSGGGTDGLRFQTFGICPSGALGIVNALLVSPDLQSASAVRLNCQDLASPQIIDASQLQFGLQDSSVLSWNGQIYDLQTVAGDQRVTLAMCQSQTSPAIQALVWEVLGQTANDYGHVVLANGSGTGDLAVAIPLPGPTEQFVSAEGASGQFDLSVSGNLATLTYEISGDDSITLENMSCLEQSAPPVDDGVANAPAGPAKFPNLLSGYSVRPPWSVAGVDYAVGFPSGTELKDPTTVNLSGVTVDSTQHVLNIQASGITLDGYDFSLHGGWGITVSPGVSGTLIKNCNFLVGSNNVVPITFPAGTGDAQIMYNTFDGGGTTANGNLNNISWVIEYRGTGNISIRYNLFQFSPGAAIAFQSSSITPSVRFNLFYTLGTQTGSDGIPVGYINNVVTNGDEQFNTIYQASGGAQSQASDGMEGASIDSQLSSTVTNYTIAYNTVLAPGPTLSMSYQLTVMADNTSSISGFVLQNNYVDATGAYGAIYPTPAGSAASGMQCSDNISLTTLKGLGYTAGSPITGTFGAYNCQ